MKRLRKHFQRAIIIAVVIIGFRFSPEIQDTIKLLNYQPSPTIARLATQAKMTDTARRLFYANNPTIENQGMSLNFCNRSEHTIILGCYVSNKGIFIKEVNNPNLQGVMEVTAAHEMLHVVYHRMSLFEQSQLDRQLRQLLAKVDNPRILNLIQSYEKQDPASVNSELHSIFGTELRHLTPELETHYRQYFTDRAAVVALSERYEGVFTALKEKVKTLDLDLKQRQSALDRLSDRVKQEAQAIASERINLQNQISNSQPTDNRFLVDNFNSRVQNYNLLVSQLREQIQVYNRIVTEHNSLTLEQKSLLQSLENK
jgi:hypothetical protein